jgi:hypothetical protein
MSPREEALAKARQCVMERAEAYGKPLPFFSMLAAAWGHTPLDCALMMVGFKLLRADIDPTHLDSYVDAIGYLACAYEIAVDLERAASADARAAPSTGDAQTDVRHDPKEVSG